MMKDDRAGSSNEEKGLSLVYLTEAMHNPTVIPDLAVSYFASVVPEQRDEILQILTNRNHWLSTTSTQQPFLFCFCSSQLTRH